MLLSLVAHKGPADKMSFVNTVRADTKKPPVLDKGTLGFLWLGLGGNQGGGGGGGEG
jgi:hypothetical protein